MVKAMSGQGHDVCNYSDTHPHMPQVERNSSWRKLPNAMKKLRRSPDLVLFYSGRYGDYDNSVVEAANDLGMYCIQWNIDSYDWQDPSPENMKNRLSSQLKPGSIILLHNGAEATVQTLPAAIAAIQGEGYQIVPVSQLLLSGSYLVDHEAGRSRSRSAPRLRILKMRLTKCCNHQEVYRQITEIKSDLRFYHYHRLLLDEAQRKR